MNKKLDDAWDAAEAAHDSYEVAKAEYDVTCAAAYTYRSTDYYDDGRKAKAALTVTFDAKRDAYDAYEVALQHAVELTEEIMP